jgi:vitamin B12 transporter
VNGQWINDQTLTSTFYYKENINALYISSKLQRKPFVAEAGLRIENTNIKGDSLSQSYTNFFLNLILSWQLSNSNALNLTCDRRIDRPNYRSLNPFVYVFDNYTYEQGNTGLKPQVTDRFNLSYTIRKTYKMSLFYTNTKHAIIKSYFLQSATKRILVMPTNMSSCNSYGVQCDIAQISLSHWVHTSIHSEIVQNNYNWIEDSATLKNEDLSFQVGLQNRFDLPWGWSGEVSGFYNSRMAFWQIDILPVWQVSGGIQKNFFDGNATLSIFSNDWFHSNQIQAKGIICGGHATTNDFTDHTIIGISFTCRFKKGMDVKKSNGKKNIDSKRISL